MEEEKNVTGENVEARLLEEYFNKIKQLLRYTKSKDDIIAQLGKDLQHYRDGFTAWAFKPFALAVIAFREDLKKDLANTAKYDYDAEKVKKNLGYLLEDFTEMMLQNGVSEEDGGWVYNGHSLSEPLTYGQSEKEEPAEVADGEVAVTDSAPGEAAAEEEPAAESGEQAEAPAPTLEELLGRYHAEIMEELKNNETLDAACLALAKASGSIDADNKLLYIYPVLKKMEGLKEYVGGKLGSVDGEGDAKQLYAEILTHAVNELEAALSLMGCDVLVTDDEFNTSQHRLLKAVETDDPALDRKIAAKLTDAYVFEGKVIFLQKTEVYKFKK